MGSYLNALADGIECRRNERGHSYYSIPCETCGKEIRSTRYIRSVTYLCPYCKKVAKVKQKIALEQISGIETPCDKRFARAVEKIEKQVNDFPKYQKAIELAKTRAENYGSIPEAMVAIELLKNGHRVIPQQKVGKYRIDFVLPQHKIAIEVDGELYHRNNRNPEREGTLQLSLGLDWKIAHIPSELIAKDIKKLERIIRSLK